MNNARGNEMKTIKPATPLPWRKFASGGIVADKLLVACTGDEEAEFTSEEQEVNAAYIVHACNAYPELEAECKQRRADREEDTALINDLCKQVGFLKADRAELFNMLETIVRSHMRKGSALEHARALLAKLGEGA